VTGQTLAVVGATGLDGQSIGLVAEGGSIIEVGPEVAPPEGAQVLDGTGRLLIPPLVNGHTHAAMTLFRGRGGDLPLMRWLEELIWPVEERLQPEDVYWGARLACLEMARNGVSTFWDMYWHAPEVARAVADSGLRAVVGPVVLSLPGGGGRESGEALAGELDLIGSFGPRVRAAVGPHAIYTVSTERLEELGELARERELPIHIHLSETAGEVEDCLSEHGLRPAHYLDRLGLLGPGTLLAHGVWLDRDELELIAERGSTVITNPVANQKLGVGRTFPWIEAREAGVPLGLGTDGPGSNDSLDPLTDLKAFALAQRGLTDQGAGPPAGEAFRIATGQASGLLVGPDPLAVGQPADFALVDLESPELAIGDPVSNLVYAATGSAVETLVVDGRIVAEREGGDEESREIIERAREVTRRLFS